MTTPPPPCLVPHSSTGINVRDLAWLAWSSRRSSHRRGRRRWKGGMMEPPFVSSAAWRHQQATSALVPSYQA
ncbi:hypothetical protein CGRA01v4_07474 [Colletotrichum graminicola]|nr:hypothetical protein CGRA01v4_07474 [Colletotrichum graminicola]